MAITSHRDLVEQAKNACGISEERAIELLKTYGNDLERVKRHQEMLELYKQQDTSTQLPGLGSQSPTGSIVQTRAPSMAVSGVPVQSLPCSKQSTQVNTPLTDGDESDLGSAQREWDYSLPSLDPPEPGFPDIHQIASFDPQVLSQAIQDGFRVHDILRYLSFFDKSSIELAMNNNVLGVTPLFYAVAAFDVNMVRLLARFGASVHATHEASHTPLLAFAIVYGEAKEIDSTETVCTLLSLGASPLSIPECLYTPYTRDTLAIPPEDLLVHEADPDAPTAWCSQHHMSLLLGSINLTHRYFLDKARKLKPPSARHRQVTRLRGAEDLLSVPYFLVGQRAATDVLIQQLLRHLVMPTKKPLVLCFAGPSGHGKTELARQLGRLLTLNLEVVDCTVTRYVTDLFGPSFPFEGWKNGSALNNFLALNAGQRSIVFLDEFEKTTTEIHQSLLLPFDDGEYRDRRNKNKVNCSGTIWILATNAFDDEIVDFYKKNAEICSDDKAKRSRSTRKLSERLRKCFLQKFEGPLTGRISDFIPFLPFTTGEQAVITHKYLMDLKRDLRLPIVLSRPKEERFIGNIRLNLRRDGSVCTLLANEHYHNQLGARSLIQGSKKVKHLILDEYLEEDAEIEETLELTDYTVDVEGDEITIRKGA